MTPRKTPLFALVFFADFLVVLDAHADVERPERGEVVNETDKHGLEGTWEIVAFEIKGKKIDVPEGKGGGIRFAKDMKVIMKDPSKKDQLGTYKIDAGKSPKHLDLIEDKDGKKGELLQGIYEVDGNKLKIGFPATGPRGKRPTNFTGDDVAIMHLKRKKS